MDKGTIFKFYNDLDTDQIIASQYLLLPNLEEMKAHTFESQDPDFAKNVKPGDYVVHENYGLGIYRGTERQIVDKVTKDYIKIEYGDGGKLYFPVTQLHMIQKYADSESKQPKLNKLNGQEWTKTKSRVQEAVNNVAKELVEH